MFGVGHTVAFPHRVSFEAVKLKGELENRMAQQSSNGNRPKLSEKGLLAAPSTGGGFMLTPARESDCLRFTRLFGTQIGALAQVG